MQIKMHVEKICNTVLCGIWGKMHLASATQDFAKTKHGNIDSIVSDRSASVGVVLIDMGKYIYMYHFSVILHSYKSIFHPRAHLPSNVSVLPIITQTLLN